MSAAAFNCPGPDRCCDDLCRGNDFGVCGMPSDAMLGIYDDNEGWDDDYGWDEPGAATEGDQR